jgi:hypothetical protein
MCLCLPGCCQLHNVFERILSLCDVHHYLCARMPLLALCTLLFSAHAIFHCCLFLPRGSQRKLTKRGFGILKGKKKAKVPVLSLAEGANDQLSDQLYSLMFELMTDTRRLRKRYKHNWAQFFHYRMLVFKVRLRCAVCSPL